MNTLEAIATAARATGYRAEALVRNYAFADVLSSSKPRRVPLAIFTHTPPSYRSAALGVVFGARNNAVQLVRDHRALGAPLLIVVDDNDLSVWQVRSTEPPRVVERATLDDVSELFARNQQAWNPDAIHRAKSIGAVEKKFQLDFVDLGLLPAIEGEIHTKLDRLLVDTLDVARKAFGGREFDARLLFRVVFRLLAAKVLQDRGHPHTRSWDDSDLSSIMEGIQAYYSLTTMPAISRRAQASFEAVWDCLRQGISFSNISADDLAFVYENTLVTPEARKLFGTHSTPRQVAEYVVQRLELHRYELNGIRIYEPFAGAGIFLVSALRHLRDLLPISWTDQQRHKFLIKHLAGDEIDPFACEVACLSLILADYPNHNGWHISEVDLFAADTLKSRIQQHNVILCNPPFEAFTLAERARYSSAQPPYSKPIAVLSAALEAKPLALGFVLPRSFILDKQFTQQRRRVEALYGSVELVELPDRTFEASVVESSLLIATDFRAKPATKITLRSTEVADRDRVAFLRTGKTTNRRTQERSVSDSPTGDLWVSPLALLWDYLKGYPCLSSYLSPRWGLQWRYKQTDAFSEKRRPGFRRGLGQARHLRQFVIPKTVWLDYREEKVRRGFDQRWNQPKLIINEGRLSRGPWRIAASLDLDGLLYSQQYFGLWPTAELSQEDLLALTGVLNGPLANAFIAVHSPAKGIRANAVGSIPIPRSIPKQLGALVNEYMQRVTSQELFKGNDAELEQLLDQIDALVLQAYDLPPRLERDLLDYFAGAARPVQHAWTHWDLSHPGVGLRLFERVSRNSQLERNWIASVFKALPTEDAALLREFGD
jgi:hypothetical protein